MGLLAYAPETDPPDDQLFWIFRLMVDKNFQRRGIGAAAMRLAIDELKEFGAAKIRTMHKPINKPAAALYESLGFAVIGELDDGDILLEYNCDPCSR